MMAPPHDQPFRALLKAGDLRAAAEWLVRGYADEVMGLCTAMVRHHDTAEDLAQDVFGRAFAGLAAFRGEASARTWLLKIARNRCIDHIRAQKREPWGGPAPDPDWDPEEPPDEAPLPADLVLQRDDVEDALAELAEADRALIVLRFRNGLEYGELAVAFGLREGAVRMRVSRSLSRMRRALEAKHERDELAAMPAAAPAMDRARAEDKLMPSQAMAPAAELEEDAGEFESLAEQPADAARDAVSANELMQPADAPPARAARAKRDATGEVGAPQHKKGAAGLVGRLADVLRSSPAPQEPSPPVEHPLTAFFARQREALSDSLRQQLLERARTL